MEENEKEFNVDQFQEEFENEWKEPEAEETVEAEDSQEVVEEQPDEPEEEPVSDEEGEEEVPPTIHDEDADKRNRAFADLRRQNEEMKKYQSFLQNLAEENGVSVEDIMKRAEERRLEAQAEEQNVPVDVLKRLQTLEQENQTIKEQSFAEQFNQQVKATMEKYNATDEDFNKVVEYAAENNINVQTANIPFETLYRMAHLDSIVEKKIQSSRQQELAEKKKRQTSAAVPTGASTPTTNSNDVSFEDVEKYLKEMDIKI